MSNRGVNYQRRAEAEQVCLLRELQVADVQLLGREEAHRWQADALRDQLEEVKSQMQSGAQMAMSAAVAAAEARAASQDDAQKYKDQVTKLRAKVAVLQSDNDRLEKQAKEAGLKTKRNTDGEKKDWVDIDTMEDWMPKAKEKAKSGLEDDLVTREELAEHVKRAVVMEQQRGYKRVGGLEAEVTRLTNLTNSLRTERNKATRELQQSREQAAELHAMLTAIGGELAHADSQRAEHEVLVAQATMEEVRELKTELKEAEGSLAEQRALIGALAQGNAAPATSEEGEQAAAAPGDALLGGGLTVDVGDSTGSAGPAPAAVMEDPMMETVRLLRVRQTELEASESKLTEERDEALADGTELRNKLQQAGTALSHSKQQVMNLKTQLYAATNSGLAKEGYSDVREGFLSKSQLKQYEKYEPPTVSASKHASTQQNDSSSTQRSLSHSLPYPYPYPPLSGGHREVLQ